MSKPTKLTPKKNTKGVWVLSIPPAVSGTGKRRREFFEKKEAADIRAKQVKNLMDAGVRSAQVAGPALIRTAINYDQLFRDAYGFEGGLAQACEHFAKQLDETTRAIVFRDMLDSHEKNRGANWGKQYLTTWKTFRKLVLPLESKSVLTLGASFWINWLNETASREGWNDRTVNDYTSLLSSVWKHGVSQELCEKNPIDGVTRRKIRRTERPVYSVMQVKAVLNAAWKYDRDLVPFFAITIFAGVRPDIYGEIGQLEWKDVNFGKKWIRVAANFDNKTNSKRFVPMEPNLLKWLQPWKNAHGRILPTNFVRRRRYLTRGKYQSPENTPETEWKELVPFGLDVRDITRHTYGSFLEAKYGDRNMVKENMGHSDFETYEQHYRNAQTPEDAKKFWAIEPPKNAAKKS